MTGRFSGWAGALGRASLLLALAGGCAADDAEGGVAGDAGSSEDAPPSTVSFRDDVYPIFVRAGCSASATCHVPRNPIAHALDLSSPEVSYGMLVGAPGGDHCVVGGSSEDFVDVPAFDEIRVEPYQPDASSLLRKLEDTRDHCGMFYGRMPPPPSPPLSDGDIETIRTWISEGAQDN